MSFERKTFLYHLIVVFVVLCVLLIQANAQEVKSDSSAVAQSQMNGKREVVAEDVEQLKLQVKQLQSLVEQQRRATEEIQRRLDETGENEHKPLPASFSRTDEMIAASPDPRSTSNFVKQAPISTRASQTRSQDKPAPVADWGRDHAFIRSADGAFETQIGGYGQLGFHGYQSGNHPP